MLKRPVPHTRRVLVGLVVAGAVVTGAAYATWTVRPATKVVTSSGGAVAAAPEATIDLVADNQPMREVARLAPNSKADAGKAPAQADVAGNQLAPPKYPADAVANKVSGKVVLLVDVAADGSVADAKVEKSEPAGVFDQAALDAAKDWTFKPAMKDGKPVAGRVRVPVTFDAKWDGQNSGAPMDVGADKEADPAAYDWIKTDPAVDNGVQSQMCDVIQLDPQSGISYCGRLKRTASQH